MDKKKEDIIDLDKQTILYITKIPRDCNEGHMQKLFSEFGDLLEVRVKDRYAFVAYHNCENASKAVKFMDGFQYEGHRLIVEKAGIKQTDGRGLGPQVQDKCFNCGKFGHWANECREKALVKNKKRKHKQQNQKNSYKYTNRRDSQRSRFKNQKRERLINRSYRQSYYSDSRSRSRSRNRSNRSSRSYLHVN